MNIDNFDYVQDIQVTDDFNKVDEEALSPSYPYVIVNDKLWRLK